MMVIFQSSMHLKVAFLFAALFLVQVVYFASKKYSLLLNLDYLIISSTMKPAFVIPEYLNRSSYLTKLNVVLHHIPDYLNEVNCSGVLLGNEVAISKAESWVFNTSSDWMQDVRTANDKCEKIKSLFGFADKPMSQEEEEFPLAYGLVVHHVPTQVYFMLSAIYQLQNQFCIAVDDGAKKEFKDQMDLLDECFPNIHVKYVNKVEWFKFSVLRAVYGCVKHLTMLKSDWKYYQYLSGVDLPLKTNLEMVRILKQLNGSFNAEVAKFQSNRLHQKNVPPPVKLWKSSLSATFSRESAEFMVRSRKVHEVYDYLKTTDCPDESFWTSIAGNPKGGIRSILVFRLVFRFTHTRWLRCPCLV
ncbi:hypothetical protein L596_021132 [Steinernema carpocapsae]|uniref:Uncharacterized protein n=1 Tax=Steinernema carpocapsae TaxID=34508 RepID=A0A4U5MVM6_STECR|nr:hypothetical protein L596_021132 [Steinernema carpocapsae]